MNASSSKSVATGNSLQARVSVVTSIHQGARDYQEDAFGHWTELDGSGLFAVVADGAGGHGGGAEASQAAVESSAETWKQSAGNAFADPEAFLANWMMQAHLAVNVAAAKVHRSARSVVVACLTNGQTAHWAHAGDCRLLRFHDGKLVERTRDDSVVQVLFERGDITEEEMGTHPDQSRLLQSLGGDDPPNPRLGKAEVEAGDVLILCSDGFWEHLTQAELEKLAREPARNRQTTLDQAVAEAVRRGAAKADNTTALMIHCEGGGRKPSISTGFALLLLLAVLAGCGAALAWSGELANLKQLWELWRQGDGTKTESLESTWAAEEPAQRKPESPWPGHSVPSQAETPTQP